MAWPSCGLAHAAARSACHGAARPGGADPRLPDLRPPRPGRLLPFVPRRDDEARGLTEPAAREARSPGPTSERQAEGDTRADVEEARRALELADEGVVAQDHAERPAPRDQPVDAEAELDRERGHRGQKRTRGGARAEAGVA